MSDVELAERIETAISAFILSRWGRPEATTESGEPYVSFHIDGGITTVGPVLDHRPIPHASSENSAFKRFMRAFMSYIANREVSHILEWRKKPEVEIRNGKVKVYCRFALVPR
jgi:hypothetical protein